jgi:hypothetical protein
MGFLPIQCSGKATSFPPLGTHEMREAKPHRCRCYTCRKMHAQERTIYS